ncbi:hypothetical protein JCM16358_22840 [Halanaerocella petrolearia]
MRKHSQLEVSVLEQFCSNCNHLVTVFPGFRLEDCPECGTKLTGEWNYTTATISIDPITLESIIQH